MSSPSAAGANGWDVWSGSSPLREVVSGDVFVHDPPTDFLTAVVRAAEHSLQRACDDATDRLVVEPYRRLVIGSRHDVVPALSVSDPQGHRALVLEVRMESTERFDLGPKRLAYQEAGILDYWFLDPMAQVLRIMRLRGSVYGWPPTSCTAGDTVALVQFPSVRLTVQSLLPGVSSAATGRPPDAPRSVSDFAKQPKARDTRELG